MKKLLQPLFDKKVISDNAKDILDKSKEVGFYEIFREIHKDEIYFDKMDVLGQGVPDLPEQIDDRLLSLDKYGDIGAFFVDGCKSWFGTKYFMQESFKVATPGAFYLFQDYGRFTCFWISFLTEVLFEYLELVGHVDSTYVFKLKSIPNAKLFNDNFSDTPSEIDKNTVKNVYENLILKSQEQDDLYRLRIADLHYAAFLAYIGLKEEASIYLKKMLTRANTPHETKLIKKAMISPTYSPSGPIYLN